MSPWAMQRWMTLLEQGNWTQVGSKCNWRLRVRKVCRAALSALVIGLASKHILVSHEEG